MARPHVGEVRVTVLGTAQDGGFPQPGCQRDCCVSNIAQTNPRTPVALGITGLDGSHHLIEASRMMYTQFQIWKQDLGYHPSIPKSISLTHAHLGHIDGLGLLGKEVMGARGINVHCSQSVAQHIERTPAYAALIEQGSITLNVWQSNVAFRPVTECGFTIEPIPVPHRSEFSDCHALVIDSGRERLLFLPDHDSWEATLDQREIREWLAQLRVNVALLDGTFWSADELQNRDMQEIPHPTVEESLQRLGVKQSEDPDIRFFHLNHTNPVLDRGSEEREKVISMGWSIAEQGSLIVL